MELYNDDDLARFEAEGNPRLPSGCQQAWLEHAGAQLWYCSYGEGEPVILLHGGLGHSGNWSKQLQSLVEHGYRAILLDTRGHGRSSRDHQAFSYELFASDVLALLDELQIERASLVGWSDGACTSLVLADQHPERVKGVLFFACNVDPSGAKPLDDFPITLQRCFARHQLDYRALSPTPDNFEILAEQLNQMQATQPNYSAAQLATIDLPVTVALGEFDEFIYEQHARYLAATLPQGSFKLLPGVSHFAPIQRPHEFNRFLLDVLAELHAYSPQPPMFGAD
jgi:Predicted hydrolases or acyltransferases (alpha/beta hydrolase superfamily)